MTGSVEQVLLDQSLDILNELQLLIVSFLISKNNSIKKIKKKYAHIITYNCFVSIDYSY